MYWKKNPCANKAALCEQGPCPNLVRSLVRSLVRRALSGACLRLSNFWIRTGSVDSLVRCLVRPCPYPVRTFSGEFLRNVLLCPPCPQPSPWALSASFVLDHPGGRGQSLWTKLFSNFCLSVLCPVHRWRGFCLVRALSGFFCWVAFFCVQYSSTFFNLKPKFFKNHFQFMMIVNTQKSELWKLFA